ncbi:MAG TPA: response regulator transcription factor [Acidimicrobiia bacterium]|nr:response regulator transcription factor [Acidimicrobiia bacterium]
MAAAPGGTGVTATRILVADDHATFVRAIRVLFEHDDDVEVVATAADGEEAVQRAVELQPDVVLMDLHMPGLDGIEATRRIVDAVPHVAVVILTMFDDDARVVDALRNGARGYLLKGARREEIRRAIESARSGEAVLGAGVARRLPQILAPAPPAPDPRAAFPHLTARELDVLARLAAGLDNAAIARTLDLTDKTVRNYVSTILTKLQVTSRTEAALVGRDAGLA